jgi:hypothetical protein
VIDEIVIIAPELNPGRGGVGDYTARLLECLRGHGNFRFLVPRMALTSMPTDRVEQLAATPDAIVRQLPVSGGRILLQYSAYGFDRFGYPRTLIRALVDWKNRTHGQLIVMFHEIWTFWPVTNKNFLVQLFHRRAIKRLLRHVDVAFTSTASQAEHLGTLSGDARIHVLPVGSNIRRAEPLDRPRQPGQAIVFGLQPARIRALRRMRIRLCQLAAVKQITKIIALGANSGSRLDKEERSLLVDLRLQDGFEQLGEQSEHAISQILATASFGIFGQDELSYPKSTTFMAYAAHELNILADFASAARPAPICWLVAPADLLKGISPAELKERAQHLRNWQEQTSSWELISRRFSEALELNAKERVQIAGR